MAMVKILKFVLIAVVLVVGIELICVLDQFRRENIARSLKATADDADATVLIANRTLINANLVIGRVEELSQKWKDVADKQYQYLEQMQSKTLHTLDKVNTIVEDTNMSLNNKDSGVLSQLSTTLASTNTSLNKTDGGLLPELSTTVSKTGKTLDQFTVSLDGITRKAELNLDSLQQILADPSIVGTEREIYEIAKHVNSITSDVDKATDSLPKIAADLEYLSKSSSKFAKPLLIARIVSLLSWLVPWLY